MKDYIPSQSQWKELREAWQKAWKNEPVTPATVDEWFNQSFPKYKRVMTDSERLVRDTKRKVAKTSRGKLDKLLAERTRWQRKLTIATNKLNEVEVHIRDLASELADELLDSELERQTNEQATTNTAT